MDAPETFFASLSAAGKELAPLNLRLMTAPDDAASWEPRIVSSSRHRSRGYHCHAFHKPISRCLPSNR